MTPIENMCEWELAAFVQDAGTKVICSNGIWWVEHQPYFFRPLLPLSELSPSPNNRPNYWFVSGYQHNVPDSSPSNTSKSYFIFNSPQDYCLAKLSHGRANKIRKGEKHFQWRRICDQDHFIEHAYPVYSVFAQRAHYEFKSERIKPRHFANWSRALFLHPKVIVSGAYADNRLCAVSIYYLVNDIFVNATYFSDTSSQPMQVHDFVLHKLRLEASKTNARLIYMGPFTGIDGIDRAKLDRGCTLISRRTNLHLHPVVSVIMKRFQPSIYVRISGDPSKVQIFKAESRSRQTEPRPSNLVCNTPDEIS